LLAQVRLAPPDTAPPYPVVVLLHGLGADEHDLEPIGEAVRHLAWPILLRAPEPVRGLPGYQWYQIEGFGNPDPVSWLRSLSQLAESLDAIRQDERVDPSRIVLGGFSQGALMTASFACRHPDFGLKAAVVLSGYLPDWVEVPPLSGLAVFSAHGESDPVIPPALGDRLADRLEAGGAQVTRRRYPIGHAVSPSEVKDLAAFLEALTA
jgi:phospholipase/carboxylesterase